MDFRGQVVIVTGAAGNLGSAVAAVLSELGASLALADMNAEALSRAAQPLGGEPLLIAGADARSEEGAARIAAETLARFGRIDALANTVGTFKTANVIEGAARDWNMLMDLNALSALRLSAAVLPTMVRQGYGRIVHVAAGAGLKSFAGASVYAASKAALMRITEAIAEEHKTQGVTANCVMPAIIDTPQNRAAMPGADHSRWTPPGEIAAVIAFLASREAGAVNGAAVPAGGKL